MARFRLPPVAGTCLFPLLLLSAPVLAEPAVALGYAPKYGPGFTHFDYVNPDAPRGGTLTGMVRRFFIEMLAWLIAFFTYGRMRARKGSLRIRCRAKPGSSRVLSGRRHSRFMPCTSFSGRPS